MSWGTEELRNMNVRFDQLQYELYRCIQKKQGTWNDTKNTGIKIRCIRNSNHGCTVVYWDCEKYEGIRGIWEGWLSLNL